MSNDVTKMKLMKEEIKQNDMKIIENIKFFAFLVHNVPQ